MAVGVYYHRRARIPMAGVLASALPPAGRTPRRFPARVGLHTERSTRPAAILSLEAPASAAGNLGFRHRKISHRRRLVVLSFLVSQVPPGELRTRPAGHSDSYHGCVH